MSAVYRPLTLGKPVLVRRLKMGTWLSTVLWLVACAHTPGIAPGDGSVPYWSGRLALQVESNQAQSFSASFELTGSAERGELALFSPLGSTVAQLAWEPGSAVLRSNGEERRFESMDALSTQATGTALPLGALFEWLSGRAPEVPGWQADLSKLADGRLVARRTTPPPPAELRIAFEK